MDSYFNKLNYTLANEDAGLEVEILGDGVGHVMSVAGSGGRVLPLLSRYPKLITCVDLVDEQLYLTELRFEALRCLSYEEYRDFFDFPSTHSPRRNSPEDRKELFKIITLSKPAKEFMEELFNLTAWNSLTYLGKWETTFAKMAKINSKFTRAAGRGIFECKSLAEQREYYEKRFPKKAWKTVLMLLGNAAVFNSLLYKGRFPKKNIPDTFYGFYKRTFGRVFSNTLLRENYFMQLLFFGRVMYPEGAPVEVDETVWMRAKSAINDVEIRYVNGNIIDVAAASKVPVDYLSFSDVPSYFDEKTGREYLQRVRKAMAPDGKIVVRNYIHVPEGTDTTGYHVITENYREALDVEKTQVYLVEVYKAV